VVIFKPPPKRQRKGFDAMTDPLGLPAQSFTKDDPADDAAFYVVPRLVTHIDDAAIAALTGYYRRALPAGGAVMDLMSSWVSHLPPEVVYGEVIGHGMNAEELAANPVLSRYFVQDLNANPGLPMDDGTVDVVTVCVSVQYLQQPVAVLREVLRVLTPGGVVAITFSNRCFPTKAVSIWQSLHGRQQCELVALYLRRAGFPHVDTRELLAGQGTDPLWAVLGRKLG
jgi:Methyltransferase domain